MDRFGRKGVMLVSLIANGLLYLTMTQAKGLPLWAVLMVLMGAIGPLFRVGSNAMVADLIEPQGRPSAYALLRMSNNLGIAVGPAIGGFVAAVSYSSAFVAAAVAYALFALLVLFLVRETLQREPGTTATLMDRGGYGSLRILDLIDYDLLRHHPKIFLGFSDISALIAAITTRSGLVAFHGPNITTLGQASPKTRASFYRAVTSDQPLEIRPGNPRVINPGKAMGVVSGGNLATLCHLLGTSYSPTYRKQIFVVEDISEAPYQIDRMLYQMKMADCFQGISGVAMGSFHNCAKYEAICDIVRAQFEDMQIPILGGFDIGHGDENMTIPMGIRATLDTDQGALIYNEAALL